MDLTFAIYDKLGGQLKNYVDDYVFAKEHNHEIGYEISQDILDQLKEISIPGKPWCVQIAECDDLNDLPECTKQLIRQFLPIFYVMNPNYKGEPCLQLRGEKPLDFYREHKGEKVWWVNDPNDIGTIRFSFDKKKIYYLYRDYPQKLTPEEKEIFDKENPFWKDFFGA